MGVCAFAGTAGAASGSTHARALPNHKAHKMSAEIAKKKRIE
jgi:uncharacterized protein VirK/YbjX